MSEASPAAGQVRLGISPTLRRSLVTVHIVASVGLLGDVMALTAISIRAVGTDDPQLAASSYELLEMFSIVFGIPLSLASLATGVWLGLSSKWGVLRYPWTAIKLGLILSVIVVGALVIGPTVQAAQDGSEAARTRLVAAGAYDVLALSLATAVSVFKPGGRRRRRTPG